MSAIPLHMRNSNGGGGVAGKGGEGIKCSAVLLLRANAKDSKCQ